MKVLIVGGGPVGLAAALALREERVTEQITVLEAAPRGQQVFSDRNIALSASSWRFLKRIGSLSPTPTAKQSPKSRSASVALWLGASERHRSWRRDARCGEPPILS